MEKRKKINKKSDFQKGFYWKQRRNQSRKQNRKRKFIGKILGVVLIGGLLLGSCSKQTDNFEVEQNNRSEEENSVFQEADWYRNSIQNLCQGNSIAYADGYYYFCSQYDYCLYNGVKTLALR